MGNILELYKELGSFIDKAIDLGNRIDSFKSDDSVDRPQNRIQHKAVLEAVKAYSSMISAQADLMMHEEDIKYRRFT